jgi:integration host factor subunit beta
MNMNKSDLMNRLAEEKGFPLSTAKDIVDMVFDDMTQAFIKGERVEIRGFGSFKVKAYKGYTGRNPRSGEKTEVKPKRLPVFKAGKELRARVDYPKELSA